MTRNKGLSQILYLIIAASVLMMVALSLVFAFNNTFSGGTGQQEACQGAVQAKCAASAGDVSVPSSCEDANGNRYTSVPGVSSSGAVDCSEY